MTRWEPRQWRVLVAALSGVFISLFPLLMVVASLPTIAEDLRTTEATLAWSLTVPLLASAVLLPTAGRLGDLYGHRRVFVIGLALSGLFGALSAVAWNPISLIVFRSISQTMGTASSPAAIALVITAFSDADRPRVLGFWASSTAIAPALGLLAGGPAVDTFGWRGLFVLQAAVVAVVLPLAVTSLKETVRAALVSFDVAGGVAFMVASGSLVFALDRAGRWRWGHPAVAVAFLVMPMALVLFRAAERRARDPILPLELLRHPDYLSSCACEALVQVATNGALFVAPLVFHEHYGAGVSRIALYLAPMPIGMALVAPLGGRLAHRYGERASAVVGSLAMAVAFFGMRMADDARIIGLVLVAWFAVGVANGLVRPAIASAAASAVDPAYYGAGMATTRMISTVGAAAGITLAISLLPIGGNRLAVLVCGACGMLAAAVSLNIRMSSKHAPSVVTVPADTVAAATEQAG